MIYILEDTDNLGEEFLLKSENLLSEQRNNKLKEYSLLSDKINGSAVYLLLRAGLKREYGMTDKPNFKFRERGKPYLCDKEGIYFSFSHCKNTSVCIISNKNTAIDIMDIRTVRSAVIKRTCSLKERHKLSQSSFPEREFMKLWTRKECYSKLDGRGLQLDFSKIGENIPEMHDIHTIDFGKYIISYYSRGTVEIINMSMDKLLNV